MVYTSIVVLLMLSPRFIITLGTKHVNSKEGIILVNKYIREYARSKGVLLWQIADKLGITDGNFSRKLRREFMPEENEKIMQIIDEISEKQQ